SKNLRAQRRNWPVKSQTTKGERCHENENLRQRQQVDDRGNQSARRPAESGQFASLLTGDFVVGPCYSKLFFPRYPVCLACTSLCRRMEHVYSTCVCSV